MKIPWAGCAFAALLAAAPVSSAIAAKTVSVGSLKLENAFTRPTPGGSTVAVGYVTIVNSGSTPDRLVSASSDISAKTQIHETEMDNGVMKMAELPDGLPIPAGKSVALKPGSYHIMFVDIKHPVKPGEVIHATLTFEKAGKVDVPFKAANSMGAMAPSGGMSGMGGMKMQ
jgi:periplasmic copper chaperone A